MTSTSSAIPRDPDTRKDVRAGPKPPGMSIEEYLEHVQDHSRNWYRDSMHKRILDRVETDVFFMLEDDFLPHPESVMKLLELVYGDKSCVMATAPMTYRCPGLHKMGIAPAEKVEWEDDMIVLKRCCSPALEGVHEVAGSSFSCFAARRAPYLRAFEESGRRGLLMTYIGHDMVITNVITQLGGRILCDFGLWGGHMQNNDGEIYVFEKKDAIKDYYLWNHAEGRYDNILIVDRKEGI